MSKTSGNLTVCLNKFIISLKGVETEIHLGDVIADAISGCGAEQCKDLKPTKLMGWAQKLADKQPLSLDQTDFDSLRAFIGLIPRLNILVISQADACFKAAKEAVATQSILFR